LFNFFRKILEDNLLEEGERFFGEDDDFLFMEDGDTVHRSKPASKWKEQNKIRILEWPSCSADLVS